MSMNQPPWKPHVTVAAIIERDGQFLLIEEETSSGPRLNQPAGHLESGESLTAAAIRETLEESAHHFEPEFLLGIYRHDRPPDTTYLRFAFAGQATGHDSGRALDRGIIRYIWMNIDEIRASRARHRSPLVLQCIDDFLAGARFPLDIVKPYGIVS
jgi:ADP-ribose pyrophosphatase YjhB (NUDIX family)